jgi:hypothetical protein
LSARISSELLKPANTQRRRPLLWHRHLRRPLWSRSHLKFRRLHLRPKLQPPTSKPECGAQLRRQWLARTARSHTTIFRRQSI